VFDVKNLLKAKKKAEKNVEAFELDFAEFYQKALDDLLVFAKTPNFDKEMLKRSANNFAKCLEIKKNKVEPYFYLSYIFNMIGKKSLAIKYLKVAIIIDKDFPGIDDLQEQISKKSTIKNRITRIGSSSSTVDNLKTESSVKLNKIQRIKRIGS